VLLQPPEWSQVALLTHGLALVDAVNATHMKLQVLRMQIVYSFGNEAAHTFTAPARQFLQGGALLLE
jgi:hypothetical protein